MFVCEECHNRKDKDGRDLFPYMHFSQSYGRCELCKKVAGCYDCGCGTYYEKKE